MEYAKSAAPLDAPVGHVLVLEEADWTGYGWGTWREVMSGTREQMVGAAAIFRERIPYNVKWRVILITDEIGS